MIVCLQIKTRRGWGSYPGTDFPPAVYFSRTPIRNLQVPGKWISLDGTGDLPHVSISFRDSAYGADPMFLCLVV